MSPVIFDEGSSNAPRAVMLLPKATELPKGLAGNFRAPVIIRYQGLGPGYQGLVIIWDWQIALNGQRYNWR